MGTSSWGRGGCMARPMGSDEGGDGVGTARITFLFVAVLLLPTRAGAGGGGRPIERVP